MKTRPLVELMEEIYTTTTQAEKDPNDGPKGTYQGRCVLKQQMKDRLVELQQEFESTIIPNRLVGFFVNGPTEDTKELQKFIASKGGIICNANDMYEKIAQECEPSFGPQRTFDTTQYNIMVEEISQIGIDLGQREINEPKYKEATCKTFDDTVQHIKKLLRDANGDSVNLFFAKQNILKTIQREKLRGEQLVVMVVGANQEEQRKINLFFNRSVKFDCPKNYQPSQKEISALLKNKEENKE